ncbi:AbrB family transcriptional regulator [Hoeflea sp. BAL378]|uniref:AbrB family transcriptional regulator n=1 Tax=Hoeflea sp. BAL378 TaxID=1547437 RepID=UPI000B2F48C4|nr:AbrB family transcriptional regulator [Hoeflea sp. BAL378]
MPGAPAIGLGLRTMLAALLCIAGGAAADWLRIPLAWILGPMVTAAILSLSGFGFWYPRIGQRIGQWTIGCSVGLRLTGVALVALAPLIPLMIGLGLLGMCAGSVASLILVRFARLDPRTAYFAMMPGGLAEMANVAGSVGARGEPVALCQALRVAIVVLVLPPVVLALGTADRSSVGLPAHYLPAAGMGLLLCAGLAGVVAAKYLRFSNYWMIGAMIGSGSASAAGLVSGAMHPELVHAAQFLLGVAIGARFRRDIISKLVRIALVSVFAAFAMIALLFGSGSLLAVLTHGDLATSVLAVAPGGLPEMAVTAQAMHLDVAFVVMFQLVRAFLVNGFVIQLMSILDRMGFFRMAEKLRRP